MPARVASAAAYRAATFPNVTAFDARILSLGDRRRLFGGVVLGVGSLTAAATMAGVVTVTAAWMVSSSLSHNPDLRTGMPVAFDIARLPRPPRRLAGPTDLFGSALASANPAYAPELNREAELAPAPSTPAAPPESLAAAPPVPPLPQRRPAVFAQAMPLPPPAVPLPPPRPPEIGQAQSQPAIAPASAGPQLAALAPPPVPLPPPRPRQIAPAQPEPAIALASAGPQVAELALPPRVRDVAHSADTTADIGHASVAPASVVPPQIAVMTPPRVVPPENVPARSAAKRPRLQLAYNNPESVPGLNAHTAIYDIAAHVVILPDGERLEAHSGLGRMLDNPHYADVKGRGPTPPNVYDLTLRSGLFHGVQALRLNPVAGSRMYGRDGILAHTYMLGPSGQSFGCVSFKHYAEFLHAFQRGEINRMVVVPHMANAPWADRARRATGERYASNELGAW